MWNTNPRVHGLLNIWVREQEHLGGPIREVETVTVGTFPGHDVDGALLSFDPPLDRVMEWKYHPSKFGYPFWWADLTTINQTGGAA